MKVVIASDHAGVQLKRDLADYLKSLDYEVVDLGPNDTKSVDYPDFAQSAAREVQEGRCERAILICGTGIGMSIAANKVPGVRAAVISEPVSAALCVEHNNVQVLCIGARMIGATMAQSIVSAYMGAIFSGGRHQRRIDKIHVPERP